MEIIKAIKKWWSSTLKGKSWQKSGDKLLLSSWKSPSCPLLCMTPLAVRGWKCALGDVPGSFAGCNSAFPILCFLCTCDLEGCLRENGAEQDLSMHCGDKYLKACPMLILNSHKAIPPLPAHWKCCMRLHAHREGVVLRAQVPSYFLILQHTVKTLMNKKMIQR